MGITSKLENAPIEPEEPESIFYPIIGFLVLAYIAWLLTPYF